MVRLWGKALSEGWYVVEHAFKHGTKPCWNIGEPQQATTHQVQRPSFRTTKDISKHDHMKDENGKGLRQLVS